MAYIPPIEPGFRAGDREIAPKGPDLHIAVRPDRTAMVRIVGKRGKVWGWIELAPEAVTELRDYLIRESSPSRESL